MTCARLLTAAGLAAAIGLGGPALGPTLTAASTRSIPQAAGPRVEITIARGARAEPTTGMVYVAVSRDNKRTPIEQADPTGAPLFSMFVDAVQPGARVVLTGTERGHPIASLARPAGR